MKEVDIIARTGLNKQKVGVYRRPCGAEKNDWSEESLRKLEGYLGLESGSISRGIEGDVELVICRIWPNPHIIGVRKVDGVELMRCKVPVQRKWKVGRRIRAKHRERDMWDYRGMVKGQ
jgi:hypothetical protein